jgi:NADH dehydrogenase FAD-containing subunit
LVAYKPKPITSVIPAGPGWAAVDWGKLHISGKPGWWLRQAADLVAFHDLEPWWKATQQWFTEFGEQDNCDTCKLVETSPVKA